MQVHLGKRKFGSKDSVVWDADELINGHCMFVGASGTGKTYTIRKFVNGLVQSSMNPVRVHVFDVHDDIKFDQNCSDVRFSETTNYGFNPLIVDADKHDGGVRKCVQNFINVLNKTCHKLGSNQEAVLRHILYDLFTANGFYQDNPDSWVLNDGRKRKYDKKYPTLVDAARFAGAKLKRLYVGADNKAGKLLEELNREVSKFQRGAAQEAGEEISSTLARKREACVEAYTAYVGGIETGKELDDVIRYGKKDELRGIVNRLEALQSIGIFKDEQPPFSESASIWRYRIKSLNVDERKLFVLFKLWDIFRKAVSGGEKDYIDTVIVLDEGHIYMDDDEDNITNILAKEVRKFGVALILASQSTEHYPDDIVKNCATKIVLGVDEKDWAKVIRDFNLSKGALEYVVPRREVLIQIKTSGGQRSNFEPVLV